MISATSLVTAKIIFINWSSKSPNVQEMKISKCLAVRASVFALKTMSIVLLCQLELKCGVFGGIHGVSSAVILFVPKLRLVWILWRRSVLEIVLEIINFI
jgi:hypothetical protein